MTEEPKIIFEAGDFKVWQLYALACQAYLAGWRTGELPTPADGGTSCSHGDGRWAVGWLGPRGGWHSIVEYNSRRPAKYVCQALAYAAVMRR